MCELRIDLVPAPTGGSSDGLRCVLEPETYALLLWSESAAPHGPYEHAMVLPLEGAGTLEQLSIDLANSPSWLQTGSIRRFAISPMNRLGTVAVDRIELVPCAPGSP
jgi:hypothetical protein